MQTVALRTHWNKIKQKTCDPTVETRQIEKNNFGVLNLDSLFTAQMDTPGKYLFSSSWDTKIQFGTPRFIFYAAPQMKINKIPIKLNKFQIPF